MFDDYNELRNFDAEVYGAIEEFVRVRDGRGELGSDPDVDPGDELLVDVVANAHSGMLLHCVIFFLECVYWFDVFSRQNCYDCVFCRFL